MTRYQPDLRPTTTVIPTSRQTHSASKPADALHTDTVRYCAPHELGFECSQFCMGNIGTRL